MKKIFAFVLVAAMALSMIGCGGGEKESLKLGMGVHAYINGYVNADADNNGNNDVVATVAAVLVDKDGKIVKCEIDTLDAELAFTSEGKAVAADAFKTKGEQGSDYGMVAYGGATKEWYEQADAFEQVVVGKTAAEVKALLADDNYTGNDEVIKAGCTIGVSDFVGAVDKALANVEESAATADDTLKIATVVAQSTEDASEEADGSNEIEVTFAAAAANKDGKIAVVTVDTLAASATFDTKGVYSGSTDAAELSTKKMLGANYNMAAYGADLNGDGKVLEWFEQADAFEAACAGKTADEVSGLEADGYGVEDVQKAGCTIGITDFVAAVVKAAK